MPLRVLIVEDTATIRQLYQELLQREGYAVQTESSGRKALELAQSRSFDCIVLDLLLPDLGGLEFLQAFQPRRHPKTRVIMASNMDDPDARERALELGAVDYIVKAELSLPQLLRRIDPAWSAGGSSVTAKKVQAEG